MKKQFRREAHAHQDKARKADYAESMKAGTASTGSWSGVELKKSNARKALRDLAKRQASQLFFVYGKWLFQHTRKLSSFALLNSSHATSDTECG